MPDTTVAVDIDGKLLFGDATLPSKSEPSTAELILAELKEENAKLRAALNARQAPKPVTGDTRRPPETFDRLHAVHSWAGINKMSRQELAARVGAPTDVSDAELGTLFGPGRDNAKATALFNADAYRYRTLRELARLLRIA